MNIRRILLSCFFILVLLSCSCNKSTKYNKDNSENLLSSSNSFKCKDDLKKSDFTFSDGTPVYTFESRYNYLKNKYPDKTILVWINNTDERYEDEVNEFLDNKHKDYAICFKNPEIDTSGLNKVNYETYWNLLSETLKSNQQVDIIFSGLSLTGVDGYTNTYQKCINNEWLEPIDDYLTNTESGKKLKKLMPDKYWESLKVNNKIYGFDGSLSCLKEDAGFMYNLKSLDKKSFKEYKDFESQLNGIISDCKKRNQKCSVPVLFYPESYTNYSFLDYYFYLDENGKVRNFFESDKAQKIFNCVSEGFYDGVILNAYDEHNCKVEEIYADAVTSLCGHYISNGRQTDKSNGLIGKNNECGEACLYFPKYKEEINMSQLAVGIYSKSKNKDKAFDAIVEIMSDKDLNNLICFGPDFSFDDNGCVITDNYYNTMGVENRLVRYPCYGVNSADSNELLKQSLIEFDLSKTVGITLDLSKVNEQINEVNEIAFNIDMEFPSEKYPTGSHYLKDLNRRLKKSGINDIIKEINRQLEEFYEKNN